MAGVTDVELRTWRSLRTSFRPRRGSTTSLSEIVYLLTCQCRVAQHKHRPLCFPSGILSNWLIWGSNDAASVRLGRATLWTRKDTAGCGHCENHKNSRWRYLHDRLTDFDEIWHVNYTYSYVPCADGKC